MIWREKRILLIILGVLLAANTMFFFTYRVQYQSRLDDLDTRLEAAEQSLAQARQTRLTTERQIQGYRKVEADIAEVFDQHWSTQPKRFTAMVGEVKRLAIASSLNPQSYSFERAEAEARTSAARRGGKNIGATEVGMSFTVQGTYEQIRRLINLLELSRQFVIIDQISLNAAQDQLLTLNLHLKTIFRDDQQARVATNRL
ncbi:MAG TPA: GspMb/PilO family protein [Thermoanaerobaculia bacterium]|nr:GspMb/PilO family protein [Thermoanaerobaculia bacterium]